MSIVNNVKIYDLEETLIASGFPMRTKVEYHEPTEKDIKRCTNLVKATTGENGNQAHAQFLSGIIVNFDLTFSNKAWVEAERYRFLTFISSQSTMHKITSFNLDECYNKYVDSRIVEIMKEKIQDYNQYCDDLKTGFIPQSVKDQQELEKEKAEKYLEILYSNPAGFTLTARMTTNYRCLRNIYKQRKDHRLPEWREFCRWIETLPYAEEFLIN